MICAWPDSPDGVYQSPGTLAALTLGLQCRHDQWCDMLDPPCVVIEYSTAVFGAFANNLPLPYRCQRGRSS